VTTPRHSTDCLPQMLPGIRAPAIQPRSCGPLPCIESAAGVCPRQTRCAAWLDEWNSDAGCRAAKAVPARHPPPRVLPQALFSALHRSITSGRRSLVVCPSDGIDCQITRFHLRNAFNRVLCSAARNVAPHDDRPTTNDQRREIKKDARRRPLISHEIKPRSGGHSMRVFAHYRSHNIDIAGFANIGGALIERFRPDFFVCQAMSAYDTQQWKLPMQKPDLV